MKKFIAMLLAASMILSMIVLSVSAETAETEAADMILTNGVIYTMVSEGDTAEAVAVKGGEIVFVVQQKRLRHMSEKTQRLSTLQERQFFLDLSMATHIRDQHQLSQQFISIRQSLILRYTKK